MKEFKIFMFIVISFFFASCGEIYVNMDNMEYSIDKNESCEMNIISRNNAPIDWTDRKFHYCFPLEEKSFFCYFLEEENMTDFDERIEISIPYEGEYRLLLSTRAESLVRYKGGLNDSSKQILVIK